MEQLLLMRFSRYMLKLSKMFFKSFLLKWICYRDVTYFASCPWSPSKHYDSIAFASFLWFNCVFNTMCPGLFLSDHAPKGGREYILPPPCINPDSKMLLPWSLPQSHFVMLQKLWQIKNFKIATIEMMTSLIMSIF